MRILIETQTDLEFWSAYARMGRILDKNERRTREAREAQECRRQKFWDDMRADYLHSRGHSF